MIDFQHLAPFRGIIVTGPHRSGTTITGRIIAHDLDRLYHTETQLQDHIGRPLMRVDVQGWMRVQRQPFVLHGATCFQWIEALQGHDIATVFVWRPPPEIRASQERAGDGFDDIAGKVVKWRDLVVAGKIANPFEVAYHKLKPHPLWHDERDGWGKRQILPDETAYDTTGFRK